MDEKDKLVRDLVHLARLALVGRRQDILLYLRRISSSYKSSLPNLASDLANILKELPTHASPVRNEATPVMPVDVDSRLQLMRADLSPTVDHDPIWSDGVSARFLQILQERRRRSDLLAAGLEPTRAILLTGPPGVGKSLGAKWLAQELTLPLLTLDLSAVMSSFLGRTGTNLRHVLDYAKSTPCVLFLDELDAIAKRRDDVVEVGELKRLVTVILQEIDDWPSTGLMLAATNHPALLDPAVWRRFDTVIDLPMPTAVTTLSAIKAFLGDTEGLSMDWPKILSPLLRGKSFSDIERIIMQARRDAVLKNRDINVTLIDLVRSDSKRLPKPDRTRLGLALVECGLGQRQVSELTGMSRDTLRRHTLAEGEAVE